MYKINCFRLQLPGLHECYLCNAMRKFEDSYRHKGLREKLVEGIRNKGITDRRVLQAINDIPRHFFLDSAFDEVAYEDKAFPIGEGQTISQPYTVVYQTQLLNIKPGDKVLEIGTGSGYQASVLAAIGAKVDVGVLAVDARSRAARSRVHQFRPRYIQTVNRIQIHTLASGVFHSAEHIRRELALE